MHLNPYVWTMSFLKESNLALLSPPLVRDCKHMSFKTEYRGCREAIRSSMYS